jgi:hypothetical protein
MLRKAILNFYDHIRVVACIRICFYPMLSASSTSMGNQKANSGSQVNISPGSSSPSNGKFFEPIVLNVVYR